MLQYYESYYQLPAQLFAFPKLVSIPCSQCSPLVERASNFDRTRWLSCQFGGGYAGFRDCVKHCEARGFGSAWRVRSGGLRKS